MSQDKLIREILLDWMQREMSDISEDHFCAGWSIDLEFHLWAAIQHLPHSYSFGMGVIDISRLGRLKQVAEYLDQWIVWDDETRDRKAIPLAEWEKRFAEVGDRFAQKRQGDRKRSLQ